MSSRSPAGRPLLERLRSGQPDRRHGAGDRTLRAHAGSADAEDDVQHRHDSRRHVGQLDSRIRYDPRGHALGIGERSSTDWSARCAKRWKRSCRNARPQQTGGLDGEVKIIGDRPAADLAADARLLKVIRAVDAQLSNMARIQRASTDANIPLSLGREAMAIGAGGSGGGAHTLAEWYDPAGRDLGLKRILLLTWRWPEWWRSESESMRVAFRLCAEFAKSFVILSGAPAWLRSCGSCGRAVEGLLLGPPWLLTGATSRFLDSARACVVLPRNDEETSWGGVNLTHKASPR